MNMSLKKVLSILIVCLTAIGIIISLLLIFETWHYRLAVTQKLQSGVDQFSSALQITDDGLVVINQVIKNVYTSTAYLNDATTAFSQTVQSTSLFMDSASTFVGDNLLTTITNTQTALGSAQASAKVVDNILTTLSRIPLIGIPYNPKVPLNIALGDVSTSLDPLQTTLKEFQTNLVSTRSNMQAFSTQISTLNNNIVTVQQNLDQAQVTIRDYRGQITSMKKTMTNARENLPTWTKITAWIITLLIAWLIIIQSSLLLQAITQVQSKTRDNGISISTG